MKRFDKQSDTDSVSEILPVTVIGHADVTSVIPALTVSSSSSVVVAGKSAALQFPANNIKVPSSTPLKRRKRGRCMSRRRGQTGSISKMGNWWTVRYWIDVPGREQRVYKREKICPTFGPGLLTASERKRRAKGIIEASGADKPETLQASFATVDGTTFRQQSETWLRGVEKRDVAPSTLSDWEGCLNAWILPTSINGIPFGDFPLASIKKTVTQELIDQMVAGDLSPKTISNYFQVVRMVFSSCVDEDGQELYPRNWKKMGLILPKIIKKEQRRPCFTKEVMNHLANSTTIKPKMRMLFMLCGATGLRIGEALGIRIEKILDNGSRIIIDEKAWRCEIHDYLKTDNGEREVDLPENVAKLLVEFIGDRTSGLLFKTRHGKQWSQSDILRRHLHPAIEEIGFEKAGAHSFRRYRNTFLRNYTNCPESVLNFWLGWGAEGMSGLYDKIKADVAFRREVANSCGVGFNVPANLSSIEPTEP
ncbi:MAG: site-specific integrase, partial [Candidatus Acidiferrales bacterium]